jgi:excisionase family DNA binding protein
MSADYVTVRYVADALVMSDTQVRRLIASGALVAIKFGPRMTRITRASFAQYARTKHLPQSA